MSTASKTKIEGTRIAVTRSQMNALRLAAEFGYRQCEKGKNLEYMLILLEDIYYEGEIRK